MLSRRMLILFAFLFVTILLIFSTQSSSVSSRSWQDLQGLSQRIGLGEWAHKYSGGNETATRLMHMRPDFHPGQPKPPGSKYTKLLVVPRTKNEDISWMDEKLPNIDKAIYVADDPEAPLHPPVNKGHEVMIYFTYIIDHYDNLPDVMIFMHSHQYAWHNADLFGSDASEMINRLSPERVMREGYMNMRCHWYPGCPDWMHPGETEYDGQKTEEILIAHAWAELFPLDPVPEVLATPCCAQFAVSRERVRTIPLEKFQYYRDWLLNTPLQDFVSGRVWEYMWQFVFTGESYHCPLEDVCYCDGFGMCFEDGVDGYRKWFDLRGERTGLNDEVLEIRKQEEAIQKLLDEGKVDEAAKLERPDKEHEAELMGKMNDITSHMNDLVDKALKNGESPEVRAKVAGRPWKEGDGF